jgi:metallo-beta-lactamase class B
MPQLKHWEEKHMPLRKTTAVFFMTLLLLFAGMAAAQEEPTENRRYALADGQAREPFKVFDNFYYIGIKFVSSWILVTSDGLILFDALFEHEEYGDYLLENMQKLGFDPADLKYLVITQGHLDHYGQARMLQDLTGVVVGSGLGDWGLIKERIGDRGPRRDWIIEHGDTLTLGDTTIRFEITPGHTPGTVSTIIPLKDGDEEHLAYFHGGTELEYFEPAIINGFISDMQRIKQIEGIDVQVNNHAFIDDVFEKKLLLDKRRPGDPHPFVGAEAFDAWVDRRIVIAQDLLDCVNANTGPCSPRSLGGAEPTSAVKTISE